MKEVKHDIMYSEPVTEIMGNPPPAIVRSGTVVMFVLFLLFILFTWLIRYPDVITAAVEITTTNPPVTLVSKITGHIKELYVHDGEKVSNGQLIGIMETTANIREIDSLRQMLDTVKMAESMILPDLAGLGELQEPFAAFRKIHQDLLNYDRNDYYGNKIMAIRQEIDAFKEYIERLKVKEKLFAENQGIEDKKYTRDAELFAGKYISESQLEQARQLHIKNNIELEQVRLDLAARQIEFAEKEQLLQDYVIRRKEEREKLLSLMEESFLNLKARMNLWVNTYFLVSPIDGTATFTKYWSVNQSVSRDEPVVSIVPRNPGDFVGRVNLKMHRSGKVREKQWVNIKLSGYPYLEYGMLRGVVRAKSLVPSGDAYIIEIAFPDGLTTLYGEKIDFTQNMQGTAEIITDDMRLIQKIFNPVRHMIIKNKSLP